MRSREQDRSRGALRAARRRLVRLLRSAPRRLDALQRAHVWLALPTAVSKKSGEDRAGSLAALIAYYGFFSMFPLLLVAATSLNWLFAKRPDVQASILHLMLREFPVIGEQIQSSVHALSGTAVAVAVGSVASLWGGLGAAQAGADALNEVWDVPERERPDIWRSKLRAVEAVLLGAVVLAGSTALSALAGLAPGLLASIASCVGAAAADTLLVTMAYSRLTATSATWRDHVAGALFAGLALAALQVAGVALIRHQLRHATILYGTFGAVMGLLSWLYLAAQVFVLGAEVNVVLRKRLWPRSLFPPPLREPDRRTMEDEARRGLRVARQSIDVSFD